ncbi:hypothetical protein LSAT2_000215 [Lamellibrachia satsuma]|nr:hypothetical protein LSAT2_000215 [Lamellibrachia satsuma]
MMASVVRAILFATLIHCAIWRTTYSGKWTSTIECLDKCEDELSGCSDNCARDDDFCAAYIKWCKGFCLLFYKECKENCSPFSIEEPTREEEMDGPLSAMGVSN